MLVRIGLNNLLMLELARREYILRRRVFATFATLVFVPAMYRLLRRKIPNTEGERTGRNRTPCGPGVGHARERRDRR
jgi:hypothetical protein